jgi:uncharacterized protein YdiU (UPF0061 family)
MKINIKDTFNKELDADKDLSNSPRQVYNSFFSFVKPKIPSNPKLIHFSEQFANEIGLKEYADSEEFLSVFSGAEALKDTRPYAMCYAGHQFGNWAGQLGDGRAINLFEMENDDKHWTLQLKGAGPTPYSRNADGFAVLRSSIREHLCSEAMHNLGVPTTRSLSLVLSGDQVLRDVLYNGNPAYEKGAIVCRVAPSFIRFGNFELFASRKEQENLKKLTDYTVKHFFPEISSEGKEKYLQFYKKVGERTLDMVIDWQRVGFVHGVMNTDNMSILGLTIDFGPYGWLENFDNNWTPNTTDANGRRYRFGNQPDIVFWNLVQLANALYTLIDDLPALQGILDNFSEYFTSKYQKMLQSKLGIEADYDADFQDSLMRNLESVETDMTIFYRELANLEKTDSPERAFEKVEYAFYNLAEITPPIRNNWLIWFEKYLNILKSESKTDLERKEMLNSINPKYVLRNYMAQLAIDDADNGNYALIEEFYVLLQKPYDEQQQYQKWYAKRPDWAREKIGCSMLSCSS